MRQRPRKADQLLLASGKPASALAHWRCSKPLRQAIDEIAAGSLARAALSIASSVIPSVPSRILSAIVPVNRYGSCRTMPNRRRNSSRSKSRISTPPIRIAALLHIVEAQQQIGQRGLAGAGMADNGDGLAGLNREADVLQHPFLAVVGEPDLVEFDAAALRHRGLLPAG